MPDYRFHHVDVFTQMPFEGNPLAVFTDGRGLDGRTMQRIAREMNLSETVFVLPPERPGAAAKLRIFTPAAELAFAGHPTIGTAFVLHETEAVAPSTREFSFDEGVGLVPVRIEEGSPFTAWLTTPPVTLGEPVTDRAGVAAALGLGAEALHKAALPRAASAGSPFFYVLLSDEAAVDATSLDMPAMREVAGEAIGTGVYVCALREGGTYSRMFAPHQGIAEDPATGSATGPLAAYLLAHGLIPDADPLEFTAEQGTFMGRRSLLRVRASGSGANRKIEVGGSAVALIEGTLRIP